MTGSALRAQKVTLCVQSHVIKAAFSSLMGDGTGPVAARLGGAVQSRLGTVDGQVMANGVFYIVD